MLGSTKSDIFGEDKLNLSKDLFPVRHKNGVLFCNGLGKEQESIIHQEAEMGLILD